MCLRQCIIATSVILAILVAPAKEASADWLFTPFVGTAFNGAAGFGEGFSEDEFERRFTYGASLGHMGAGVFGFELDFSYSPNFFETIGGDDGFTFADDSNVTTLMANMVLGAPIGGQSGPGIRPYGVAGVGLLRTKLSGAGDLFDVGDVSSNDFGFNIGGGIVGFVSDNLGIRGDVRYFRAFNGGSDEDAIDFELSDFTYWRASVGLTFRFGGR